jgi:hypothetical protein
LHENILPYKLASAFLGAGYILLVDLQGLK